MESILSAIVIFRPTLRLRLPHIYHRHPRNLIEKCGNWSGHGNIWRTEPLLRPLRAVLFIITPVVADHHHTYACDHCHDHHPCLYGHPVLSPVLSAYAPLSFLAFRLRVVSAFAFPSCDALVSACLARSSRLLRSTHFSSSRPFLF